MLPTRIAWRSRSSSSCTSVPPLYQAVRDSPIGPWRSFGNRASNLGRLSCVAPRYALLRDVERRAVEAVAEFDVAERAAALDLEHDRVARVDLLNERRRRVRDDRVAVREALN